MSTITTLRRQDTENRRHAIRRERTVRMLAKREEPCDCPLCQMGRGLAQEGGMRVLNMGALPDTLRQALASAPGLPPELAEALKKNMPPGGTTH